MKIDYFSCKKRAEVKEFLMWLHREFPGVCPIGAWN